MEVPPLDGRLARAVQVDAQSPPVGGGPPAAATAVYSSQDSTSVRRQREGAPAWAAREPAATPAAALGAARRQREGVPDAKELLAEYKSRKQMVEAKRPVVLGYPNAARLAPPAMTPRSGPAVPAE